VGTKR